jgi:hypothetical protein
MSLHHEYLYPKLRGPIEERVPRFVSQTAEFCVSGLADY